MLTQLFFFLEDLQYCHFFFAQIAFIGFLEEDFRSILRTPSSLGRSFSHRRINSLPSFDRSFFQDRTGSFTECSIAGKVYLNPVFTIGCKNH